MLLFVAFFLPFLLSMGIQSIQQNAFLKVTTEVQQMVEYEGGITDRIKNVADNLNKKDLHYHFMMKKEIRFLENNPLEGQLKSAINTNITVFMGSKFLIHQIM